MGLEVKKVEIPYSLCGQPFLISKYLFAAVNLHTPFTNSILKYDIKTGKHEIIYSSKHELSWLTGNEKWLVWVEGETTRSIKAESLGSRKRKVIETGRSLYAPTLSGDYIAWVEKKKRDKGSVILYNLKTGQKKVIASLNQAAFTTISYI